MTLHAKTLLVTLFGFFGLISSSKAQTDSLKNDVYGWHIFIPVEFPAIDNKALNQQLNSFGFPPAKHPVANYGVGGQIYINRTITTLSFNKTIKKTDQEVYLTETEYRSTSLNLGYDLTKSPWYSLYPYVGFKGCSINYLYREKRPSQSFFSRTSFDNYFQRTLNYKEVTNSLVHLDLGFGISHQWFYLVNFRFGYLLPLETIEWKTDKSDMSLNNSPTIDYNYYFTMSIGLGDIMSGKDYRKKYNRQQ